MANTGFKVVNTDIGDLLVRKDLFSESSLWATGNDGYGGLGDGLTSSSPYTLRQTLGGPSWKKISTGSERKHSLSIKSDGTLWAYGRNTYGQLGDGTTTNKSSPVQIGTSTWKEVSCGYHHTIAIKSDGSLWTWGYNTSGQLGSGTTINRSSPAQVGTSNNWNQICAFYSGALTINLDGTIWGWGENGAGTLGDNTSISKSSPVQVNSSTNNKTISCGRFHTLLIKTDGTLWTWGSPNGKGALGIGNNDTLSSPVQVGLESNWSKISCGYYSSIATKTNGTLWTWGYNNVGQLGQNDSINRSSPVQVGNATNWKNCAMSSHSVAVKTDGTLWAWGENGFGQCGTGSINVLTGISSPTQVGSSSDWSSVYAGSDTTHVFKI